MQTHANSQVAGNSIGWTFGHAREQAKRFGARAKDRNGASAISYPTWLLWTGANAATAMYAATNLNDVWLAFVSSIYALCCMVVIALTAFKRLAQRRTKGMPSRGDESNGMWAASPAGSLT